MGVGAPGRVELPTNGLGNRCSIHLSYGAKLVAPLSHDDNDELRIRAKSSGDWACVAQLRSVTNQKLDAAFKSKRRLRGALMV